MYFYGNSTSCTLSNHVTIEKNKLVNDQYKFQNDKQAAERPGTKPSFFYNKKTK